MNPFPERADMPPPHPTILPNSAHWAGFQDSLESFLEASREEVRKILGLLSLIPGLKSRGTETKQIPLSTRCVLMVAVPEGGPQGWWQERWIQTGILGGLH